MSERDHLAEGIWSRARTDAGRFIVSPRGWAFGLVVLAVCAGGGAAASTGRDAAEVAIVTVAAAMAGMVLVVLVVLGVTVAMTPVRQRDEARNALTRLTARRRAPLGVDVTLNPPFSADAEGPIETVMTAYISNAHTHPIADVLVNFTVPFEVDLARCDENGNPLSIGKVRIQEGEKRCWEAAGAKLYGGGASNRFYFKLVIPEPREFDVRLSLTAPGFEPISAIATLAPQVSHAEVPPAEGGPAER